MVESNGNKCNVDEIIERYRLSHSKSMFRRASIEVIRSLCYQSRGKMLTTILHKEKLITGDEILRLNKGLILTNNKELKTFPHPNINYTAYVSQPTHYVLRKVETKSKL